MNPLYRNDRPGVFPESYYVATAEIPAERPPLDGDRRADLVVIGAGYTGLSTALHAAEKGLDVVVVEAHRVGFGASGRNGGQVGTGWNKDQHWLEKRVGRDDARRLWDLTVEAKALTRDMVAKHAPEAAYKPGVLQAEWTEKGATEAREYATWLAETYDYGTEYLDRDAVRSICRAEVYVGGVLDIDAGHLHPLRYCLGLARAAEARGATIHERTEAIRVAEGRVETASGTITADNIVIAGNGYLPGINKFVANRVMPINSFIAATEPLGDRADEVLPRDVAVADDRFVVNYFRLSEDRRLLFGGRENYGLGFPDDILTALRARMLRLFPNLDGVKIDYHWGGTLGITMHRLPMVRRVGAGVLAAGGFSGHGVAITGLTGKILAEAVAGQAGRFDLMASLPVQSFPGGAAARAPLLTLAMTWFSLRDRLGI
ncbi:MAG: FAD-binding oxidoreductase [Rhodobacteraceae bacterium]|nr:MAG: FAD-binding oxidoreductase [Paracoccaceae bacterium]